jgi:hypothetical protein
MDSYLIRIYRRDKQNPDAIVGIIEEIGTESKEPFKDISELCGILINRKADKAGERERLKKEDKSHY